MAYQPEVATYETGVYQLEIADPVQGGVGGLSNTPLLQLANRTAWLYQQLNLVIDGDTIPPTVAPLDSAVLTGSPKAPTAALGDNSTLIATTAFVQSTVNGLAAVNVAGNANVTLAANQWGRGIVRLSGALTGNIAVIFPAQAGTWTVHNITTGPYTVTCKTASGTGVIVSQGMSTLLHGDGTNILGSITDFISPSLTGTPTAPTATAGTSTTQLATTAFVTNAKNGATTVNVAGNANVTLTAAQAGVGIILLTGALTGPITVFVPAGTGQYIIANNTTGAYTLRVGVSGASGATAIVPQSNSVVAYSDGSNIVLAGAASTSSFTRYSFTATAAQTTFNAVYTVGNVLVMVNGAALAPSDVTATDSATVVLSGYNGGAGCVGGEDVEIIAFSSFTVANAMTPAGGTFTGPVMLAGGDTGVTPAQFDDSTNIATTAYVQQFGMQASTLRQITGSATLTASDFGSTINNTSSGAATWTMPAKATGTPGARIEIVNFNANNLTITMASGEAVVRSGASSVTSFTLLPGDTVVLEVSLGTTWLAVGGSWQLGQAGLFGASFSGPGYQRLPSGLIWQWGSATVTTANTLQAVTLPIAYPNGQLNFICTSATPGAYAAGGTNSGSKTTGAVTSSVANGQVYWQSIGW